MKRTIILGALLLLTRYGNAQNGEEASADFEKIQWLIGQWNRTNSKPGGSGIEQWKKVSASRLEGRGITMKGKDTVLVEILSIVIKGPELFYVADVPENKEPVYFRITKVTDNEFICENQAHDFPKVISYKKEGLKLKATISGNGRSIDYFFEQKNDHTATGRLADSNRL